MDRITTLRTSHSPSREKPNPNHYLEIFRHSFGIYASEDFPIEDLVLSFDHEDGNYLRSRPLHHRQKLLERTETEMRFCLHLYITSDLKMELLSRANSIRIEQPEWLHLECLNPWRNAIERNRP